MPASFNFAPERNVPVTLPREASASVMSMGGWQFTARPTTPYQKKFKVTLHGMEWYLRDDGRYDLTRDRQFNAALLEQFYETHEMWDPFNFAHQHLGPQLVRFAAPVQVPAGKNGLIDPFDVMLIQHNPGY